MQQQRQRARKVGRRTCAVLHISREGGVVRQDGTGVEKQRREAVLVRRDDELGGLHTHRKVQACLGELGERRDAEVDGAGDLDGVCDLHVRSHCRLGAPVRVLGEVGDDGAKVEHLEVTKR